MYVYIHISTCVYRPTIVSPKWIQDLIKREKTKNGIVLLFDGTHLLTYCLRRTVFQAPHKVQ